MAPQSLVFWVCISYFVSFACLTFDTIECHNCVISPALRRRRLGIIFFGWTGLFAIYYAFCIGRFLLTILSKEWVAAELPTPKDVLRSFRRRGEPVTLDAGQLSLPPATEGALSVPKPETPLRYSKDRLS